MQFGLIGCGGIGALRAQALSKTQGSRLAAACDADRGRASAIAQQFGATATTEWRELIDSPDLDAVIVSTPPSLHADMCIQALRAGKHVLCEKPLARTPQEGRRMLDAASESNRLLATGFNYRFYPSIQRAKQLLDEGAIGDLDHIRSYTGYSAADHDHEWLHDAQVMGGGALRDNGIHLIDLTCYFLGDVAEVQGYTTNRVWHYDGCEDNGFALLRNRDGNVATLHASWTEWRGYRLSIELYGTLGCIRAYCFPMYTQLIASDRIGGRVRKGHSLFFRTQVMEKLRSYRWVVVQSFVQELTAFTNAAGGAVTELASGADGLRALEVADAAGQRP